MKDLVITGFNHGPDPAMPDHIVKQFLLDSFGKKALTTAKVWHIRKIPFFIIYIPPNLRPHIWKEVYDFLFGSTLRLYSRPNMPGLYFADCLEDYLGLAKYLEGVDDENKIRHLYKVRAFAGNTTNGQHIEIGNFQTEKPEDFDYLTDYPGLFSYNDLTRAYILGTVAHEVAHRLRSALPKGWDDDYRIIVQEEINPTLRKKYVTDYVLLHEEVYKNETSEIENEDFVEAIRILLTNPEYLQEYYPKRYDFLRKKLPFLAPGTIIPMVQSI